MEFVSTLDPTRNTVGSIYRDAQINGERGVVIGDVNHEITKDLVQDINEAIEQGTKEMEGFDAARRQMADSIKDSVKPGGSGGKGNAGSAQPKTADELLKSLGKGQ